MAVGGGEAAAAAAVGPERAPAKKHRSALDRVRLYGRLSARRARAGHLGLGRQLAECAVLLAVHGLGPGYYHLAGFWRREVPWAEKTKHLSAGRYRRAVAALNPAPYRKLSQNKLSERAILHLLGIPTSEFLGYVCGRRGRGADGSALACAGDLEALLMRTNASRFCAKPIEGWAGRGFRALEYRSGSGEVLMLGSGRTLTLEALWERELQEGLRGRAMLERYLEQHPVLARLNPTSVNTLRIWAVRRGTESPRTTLAYLRIGRQGSLVDNQSSGGIVAPVDLATGVLSAAIDGLPEREEFPVHPDHGAAIEGAEVPHFEAAKALVEACLGVFPGVGFAGLDIAITADGPVVIEMNTSPDREGAAFVDIPTRRALGLED